MTEVPSFDRYCDLENAFHGRSSELDRLMRYWKDNRRIFILSGFKSIGKTRLAEQFIRHIPDKTEIFLDFRKHCIKNMTKFEHKFLELIKLKSKHLQEERLAFKDWLDTLMRTIEDSHFIHLFYFDNIENILNTESTDDFLEFLTVLVKRSQKIRIVLTSTITTHFARLGPICHNERVLPLSLKDSIALLQSVCQGMNLGEYCVPLAKLCEGLPLAIIMTGCELSDAQGFISPTEMVEILICNRLHALSQEFYPAEDRIDSAINAYIRNQSEVFRQRLSALSSMQEKAIELNKVQEKVGEGMSMSMMKFQLLQTMLNRNLVDWDSAKQKLFIHGMLKDYIGIKDALRDLPEEAETDDFKKDTLLARMKDNMKLLGMNTDEVERLYQEDPNTLQQKIKDFFDEVHYVISQEISADISQEKVHNADGYIMMVVSMDLRIQLQTQDS